MTSRMDALRMPAMSFRVRLSFFLVGASFVVVLSFLYSHVEEVFHSGMFLRMLSGPFDLILHPFGSNPWSWTAFAIAVAIAAGGLAWTVWRSLWSSVLCYASLFLWFLIGLLSVFRGV